jgi:hypothetical protein
MTGIQTVADEAMNPGSPSDQDLGSCFLLTGFPELAAN